MAAGDKTVVSLANGFITVIEQADGSHALETTSSGANSTQAAALSPLIDVTPVLDTNAYSIGDVFFVATQIPNALRVADGTGFLQSLYLIDKSDAAGLALDLYFFDAAVTFGTINAPPSISDADAAHYMGHVSVASGDWKDLGGVKVAQENQLSKNIKPVSATTTIYVAAVIQTALTFAASDLVLRFGFDNN